MLTPQASSKKASDHGRLHVSPDKDRELADTLAEIRAKQREALTEQEAKQQGVLYINLKTFPIPQDALLLLDRAFCERERVACFFTKSDQIRLGTTDPANPAIIKKAEELREKHDAEVLIYKISEESLAAAFKKYDAIPKTIKSREEGVELSEVVLAKQQEKITTIKDLEQLLAKVPLTEFLALVIGSALKTNASDVHIEAEADDIKVRMRIDGILHDVGTLPSEAWSKIISRIKLIAGLKINIVDKAQDGRFTIFLKDDRLEVRVSTVPTSYGESVVMRLLRFTISALTLDKLGLSGYSHTTLQRETAKPNGMIIATGPTGCGKTTTLYAILQLLNSTETKILTLEDPIEYKLKGVNQTQVNPLAGLDFAKGLRSLLRQDPDVIMVGEIRDLETADTAINAALTGHLVLSTLHTNSAAGAIPRFLAMGSKTFLLAPAINAIIGQRLIRLLCPHCKEPDAVNETFFKQVKDAMANLRDRTDLGITADLRHPENFKFYKAKGCAQCNDLGYRGRIGIFEIMTMNKDLEKLILAGNVSEYGVQETAQKHGMITMLQDGILKALEGITSLEEIFRQAE